MTRYLHSLLKAIDLEVPSGLANLEIKNLSCDSREIKQGDLFLGLEGEKVDGGTYWARAIERGACAAIISKNASLLNPPKAEDPVVIFPDPVSLFMGKLAADFWDRPSDEICLIGVTGTNGKTTTSYLIEYLISFLGKPSALFGTLINRWPNHEEVSTYTTTFAVPLQEKLRRAVKAGAKYAAMEVSSHALSQNRIAGCNFSGAIFTNLSRDHLDYHDSMESYFKAKASLFRSHLIDDFNPRSVVNIDDKWGALLAKELDQKCWTCALTEKSKTGGNPDLYINNLQIIQGGYRGELHTPIGSGCFSSPLVGDFNYMNILQAVGILVQRGLPLNDLLVALNRFPGVPGRMQVINMDGFKVKDGYPLVIVDYAHTPDGLKNALVASRSLTNKKLICVFGCGGDRDRGKRSKMGEVAAKFADYIVVTSDNPRQEDPKRIIKDILIGIAFDSEFSVEPDRSVAIQQAIAKADKNDVVLIAGKGHEDYQILQDQTIYFDDREQAKKALCSI
ncbi:UDP-N-acetylmuramoyl-L-alanyl-D-glutamate--2,6-diaminopimelate ligase [Prochlorococcus marinus]|uniref:UDP-N-acetylmuramoyl-L-alanyl-D-glutamate--2,6-diaminopimelate ligase n=1 Tax=Prochlorococcus marinus XMU1408 TaxID=2213228 RepID=A0A318R6U7_PROMR|nr:UDP-N-acetylmuramoyl-L-alanyl-D-glutamate--2,6-diaminopimelate ligase [Prochlorococcus marinus]MBW3041440.1 UDP-N-acetylmuramoyl-L-alanyl-D-glutamate--2,6-diaminopimelate ligase [Prochlorococcus marinus str. XMU1408]PYE03262.1 UDP-N-acetylmuramoyl-L-alanyl-D-glutamate--2,6-diaminopimelate ligase [Prochlorococcus marinus XMU1408]